MPEGWIDAKKTLPENGISVLAVKQLRDGSRDICITACYHNFRYLDEDSMEYKTGPHWMCGWKNEILYWMPLPEMPEKGN